MSEVLVVSQNEARNSAFAILKAIAVIFVVVAHSGGPSWLVDAAYIFCVPVFFICTGYFFKLKYLDAPQTYVWRRCKHIYWPFWVWSVAFLVLHNLFFWVGLLSEDYGNALGGVTHPYSWHQFVQNLWSVTFNMSGYDPFICGAFWFFRTMFISSLAFLALFLILRKFSRWKSPVAVAVTILGISLFLTVWKVLGEVKITGVSQGGYRELLAVAFISIGFLYRQYETFFRPKWLVAGVGMCLLVLFTWLCPTSMGYNADFVQFIALPLPVVGAFLALHVFSGWMAGKDNALSRGLVYIGDRTLYVFAFHLLAFKLVSIVKVMVYDLPWSHVGGHPVVHDEPGDLFFLLYILVGVALPLLVVALWRKLDERYDLTWINCLKYTGKGLLVVLNFIKWIIIKIASRVWKSILNFFHDMKEFIKASNPSDE